MKYSIHIIALSIKQWSFKAKEVRGETKLQKNGFVIQSYTETAHRENLYHYSGIGRYTTWPLEDFSDDISVALNKEAQDRWFGYTDSLWVVPDAEYLRRYKRHCDALHLPTFCLQVESINCAPLSSADLPVEQVLGLDYVDADMATSCLYEDLTMETEAVRAAFAPILRSLNVHGLLNHMQDMQRYLSIRDRLIASGYDMEEYFLPTTVRLTRVWLEDEDR